MANVPPFHGNISFNAHHSPMGAFFSFTCGHFGTRGGLAAQIGRPANQDIYIGVKDGDRHSASPLRCLPFYEGADKGAQAQVPEMAQQAQQAMAGGLGEAPAGANYLVEQAADPDLADPDAAIKKPRLTAYRREQIRRHYGWGTDKWFTSDLAFEVCTPFGPIPDPAVSGAAEMRQSLLPAIVAELRVDNRQGTQTKTGFFALGFHEPGVRILDEGLQGGDWKRVGFALRDQLGVAGCLLDTTDNAYTPTPTKPFVFMRWTPDNGLAEKDNPVHLLGSCPGIGFEVPPGKCYSLVLALGCHLDSTVTTRLDGRYLYSRYFASLEEVLDECLTRGYELWKIADARDSELLQSGLNAEQQFLMAHATRSYYGSTQLLEIGGRPYWIVNEGEYCMMNTLDLSVDHVFWELKHNPWVVRNLLDNFVRFYSYQDQVKDPRTGSLSPGGISFCHDQGIHNQFSPLGRSSYELANLKGCFSHMTQEQLCNWALIAASYVAATGDVQWARQNEHILEACFQSMMARSTVNGKVTGVMALDSSRCGSGQEITTYDSLDESLGQARNNLYLAVKCWATYLGLFRLATELGNPGKAEMIEVAARAAARTVAAAAKPDGSLPAVLEKENKGYGSRILPAIEGLVYPLWWDQVRPLPGANWLRNGDYRDFLDALRKHTATLLKDPENRNRFPDGGIKLSSTSNNSWASKIALFEQVARQLFNLDEAGNLRPVGAAPASGWEKSDAAHTRWQTEGSSAYWACSDQMVKGIAIGSKYYPRIVTAMLWMG